MAAQGGLRDVVAADSAITSVDGERGELRYRGYPIARLARRCSFEEAAFLLWHGELPGETELTELRDELRARRGLSASLLPLLRDVPDRAHPLDVLRYVVSWDALRHARVADNSREANLDKAMSFTAWFPVVVAAFHRKVSGLAPVPPPDDLDSAAAFLLMLHGRQADEVQVRTLDTSFVLHADHELNASTFAARVTIATRSNLHAAIASALGTLSGPLHGGASDQIIRMLEAIGTPARAEHWVQERLAGGDRIMGFGHPVYTVADPRSYELRAMAERLLAGGPHQHWAGILDEVARVVAEERGRYPNVDLWAAVMNHELGILPNFYSAVFACSRIVGWTAHAMEQLGSRLIRPTSRYVGPEPRELQQVLTA